MFSSWKWEDRAFLTVPSSLKPLGGPFREPLGAAPCENCRPWRTLKRSVNHWQNEGRRTTDAEQEREKQKKGERSSCPLQAVFRVTPKTQTVPFSTPFLSTIHFRLLRFFIVSFSKSLSLSLARSPLPVSSPLHSPPACSSPSRAPFLLAPPRRRSRIREETGTTRKKEGFSLFRLPYSFFVLKFERGRKRLPLSPLFPI